MAVETKNDIGQENEEIKRLREALAAERIKTEIAAGLTDFGLWEYDIETEMCYQYRKLKGKYSENLEPIPHFYDTVKSWGIVHNDDMPTFKRFCDAMKDGEPVVGCDVRVVGGDYDLVWFRYEGRTVRDETGKPIKVVGRTLDITLEKGGVSDSTTGKLDPLTETYTIEAFRDIVKRKRSGNNRYGSAALLYVGIDRFRDVMAYQGQDYTDYLQKTAGKILKDLCASERDALVARVRGGEFTVYYAYNDAKQLEEMSKRIISAVGGYIYNGTSITVSVGISLFKAGKASHDIFSESVTAFTEAEKSGGGRFMTYSVSMSEKNYDDKEIAVSETPVSGGAATVYGMLVRSFSSEKERIPALRAAFKAAGEQLGFSALYIYRGEESGFERYTVYRADERPEEECPQIAFTCSEEQLEKLFKARPDLSIIGSENVPEGLELKNGAVCAEIRAVRYKGSTAMIFAAASDSPVELSDEDRALINILYASLGTMYRSYSDGLSTNDYKQLHTTIIGDHRMEGFTIIPGSFVVDFSGRNAVEHYALEKGDICYKKIYGRSEPCENCPAVTLAKTGESYAAAAQYINGCGRWLDVTASVGENRKGEKRYVISSTDITDCLGKIQMTDRLTGLMTFNVFISEALRITAAEKDAGDGQHRFALVINIAEFNRINEEHGFETGNAILTTIADIIAPCAGADELVCRAEDSRFALMLKNEDSGSLDIRLSLLLSSLTNQVYEKLGITIYLLVGLCDMTESSIGVMAAIDRAIEAQKTLRNRTYYRESLIAEYDNALSEKIHERREIEKAMYTALENNEFCVYYQPKVNIGTGKVVGAEALVRWIKPNGEMVSPGKFVPIFEENGFITEMDFAVYKNAMTDISRWLDEGIEIPLVSLNVSRRHLTDEDFCVRFNTLADEIGVPHEYIELEITESLLTENTEKLVSMATWFKERGYRISIDDFGSGYSSLNLITMLPFDTLKIDGGFFLKNDLTEKNKKVIMSVVSLAKSLNLTTVSEGVETQNQVDFLRDLGCDMVQGFFYYKPMSSENFRKLLKGEEQ